MQTIDFYALERPAQERFKGSVEGRGLPAPILRSPFTPSAPRMWAFGSVVSFVVFVVLLVVGYGSLTSGRAILGMVSLAFLVLFASLTAFGILHAIALRRAHQKSPFRLGLYLFPVGLIDARTSLLRHYPLDDLSGVFGPDVRGVTLDFGGQSFSFPITDPAEVSTAKEEIEQAKSAVAAAGTGRESVRPKAMAALDPFQGYANPLVSSEKMKREKVPWAIFAWAIAAGIGVVLGGIFWLARNAKSDDAMFAHAAAANDVSSYQAYLAKGARHKDEINALLLPRALLRDAVAVGTVDAIEQFLKDHPKGPVATEARAALRAALLVELTGAVKAGTLAALDDFVRRHPGGDVAPEIATARHGVYQTALANYLAAAPDKTSPPVLFMQRLLAWSEQKGPAVEVRFHTLHSKTLEKADRAASQSRQWRGGVSYPSHYFDDDAEKADRDLLVQALTARFAEIFPPEILTLTVGALVTDHDAPLPTQVNVPTLFIERSSVWAGSIQASTKPRGVFVGLELSFEATFRAKDDTKPVKVKLDVWRQPSLGPTTDADKPEDSVYAAMRATAYDQWTKKLVGTFFKAK